MQVRNVKLVSVNDEGYRAYVNAIIAKSKEKSSEKAMDCKTEPNFILAVSRTLEYIVRRMIGGSDSERVIKFEQNNGFRWVTNYIECDAVRQEDDDTLTITEIKARYNTCRAINCGCKQVVRDYNILKEKFTNINLQIILVDYLEEEQYSEDLWYDGIPVSLTAYPLKEVTSYADNKCIRYDEEALDNAKQSAIIKKQKRFERQQNRIAAKKETKSQLLENHHGSGDFSDLLALALEGSNNHKQE